MKVKIFLIITLFFSLVCCKPSEKTTRCDSENESVSSVIENFYFSDIRPDEELQLKEIYTNKFEYVDYDDNYDDFFINVRRGSEVYSLVNNDIHKIVSDLKLKSNDLVEIQWLIDSMRPEGDKELLLFEEFAVKISKIKEDKKNELDWTQYQDSLRNEILKHKGNHILKESFLQEMYIRNVVNVTNDSLFAIICFNVHSNDCGAPDCYCTKVSFCFELIDTLIFPEKMYFHEHEYGCVEEEKKLSGTFQLMEQTEKHIIYHSAEYRRTLVLFNSNKESGTFAYYFTEVERDRVNGENVYKILKEYDEKYDMESIYPFTSTVLNRNEYENFLP